TIESLKDLVNNAKNTASGLVEWNGNSLETLILNILEVSSERGVPILENYMDLSSLEVTETNACLVKGIGVLQYNPLGTPDYNTSFPAFGGIGAWEVVINSNFGFVKEHYIDSTGVTVDEAIPS